VKDVPNDQGGKVKLSWDGSYLDPTQDFRVTAYDLLRSVPDAQAAALRRTGAPTVSLTDAGHSPRPGDLVAIPAGSSAYYWEYIATTPALYFVNTYSYVASTTSDSIAGSNPKTAFMVVARSEGYAYFWPSTPDSGYSVDNLGPAAPSAFAGEVLAGTTRLHWAPNAEPDFAFYRVYRGSHSSFVPGPTNLIASLPGTVHEDVTAGLFVYKLSAVDAHGNESPVVSAIPGGVVEVGDVPTIASLSFAPPSPNPSRTSVVFDFGLGGPGWARLEVFDATGRRVRTIGLGDLPAGPSRVTWDLVDDDGRAARPGLYFARLETGEGRLTRRLAITR